MKYMSTFFLLIFPVTWEGGQWDRSELSLHGPLAPLSPSPHFPLLPPSCSCVQGGAGTPLWRWLSWRRVALKRLWARACVCPYARPVPDQVWGALGHAPSLLLMAARAKGSGLVSGPTTSQLIQGLAPLTPTSRRGAVMPNGSVGCCLLTPPVPPNSVITNGSPSRQVRG